MKVYVAWICENDWETEPFNIGVYSSKEKAKKAILEWLNKQQLSLKPYEEQEDLKYEYGIEHFELDK